MGHKTTSGSHAKMSLPGQAQPNEVFHTILYVIIDYLLLAPNHRRSTRRKAITHLETVPGQGVVRYFGLFYPTVRLICALPEDDLGS
ncbi:hypothetical protein BJX68DRAFT_236603 [Aspergillus pseudodeflectus]|uniref:Uncharacterized protein n=1 Tax=Aspergillus pseudodeflectus TaxID=176178 RepID=A0ABR4KF50_9EURO